MISLDIVKQKKIGKLIQIVSWLGKEVQLKILSTKFGGMKKNVTALFNI